MSDTQPGQEFKLDLSYLNDISGGSTEFMIEMIDIFLEQTPVYFQQLRSAIDGGDWKSVGDAAHKIKPTLAFMGAEAAKEDMQRIEKNARAMENLDTIEPEYQKLSSICETLYIKLAEHKKELESQL